MAKGPRINRREFLGATTAAAIGATASPLQAASQETPEPKAFRSSAGSLIPFSRQELFAYKKATGMFAGGHLSEIAFPLGGIGTGTVSLGGRGELRNWAIFNRPGKGKVLPFSFAALWVSPKGETATVKVVEGPLTPPFGGAFGYTRESAQGLPRFQKAEFTGTYPFAGVAFEDHSLPVTVSLEAFNPFIPLNVDDSSLPVAILRYTVSSRSKKPVDLALAFSLLNAVGYDGVGNLSDTHYPGFGGNLTKFRNQDLGDGITVCGLDMVSTKYEPGNVLHGSMSLITAVSQVTARTEWGEGKWWDSFQEWLDEFTSTGEVADSVAMAATEDGKSDYATLAPRWQLLPGESKSITFILAWYFPVRENYWNDEPEVKGQKLRNYYGSRFANSWEAACYTAGRLKDLESQTRSFQQAFFSSSFPSYVLDTVSSQAAILRTNTCMLLEGKQFFAFEGCGDDAGCCPMNCTHVWNYEQALAFLFPELERSMRRTDFEYNMRPDGSMSFRTLVPVEQRAQWKFRPAADGQMGCILKLYREWQISGDTAFLRELWPQAKTALEFAWRHWDRNRDGVMEGQQHNTYDIEFYGPNTMMGTLYLGALKAGAIMADAAGDKSTAELYRQVYQQGCRNLEDLWNGEYYIQSVPPFSDALASANESAQYGTGDSLAGGKLRYQYGAGCLSDQVLGEWFAEVAGLAPMLSPERVRRALQSIYRYNFKNSFYDHPNTQRIYALNDDKGLLLCTWPKGNRPELPFVYCDEVWTGIEYQVAAHLIYQDCVEEGLALVKAIRDRYDGERRNPWNEVECGSHYARALASWSVLLALSGFHYSAPDSRLTFAPRLGRNRCTSFFCAGSGWGIVRQEAAANSLRVELEVLYGNVPVRYLSLGHLGGNPKSVTATVQPGSEALQNCKLETHGDLWQVDLQRVLSISAGHKLRVDLE